ncbi:hypothetical protein [Kordia jejudonensis]|uniref:hypothetical protein n=1 Tax=Kordia jejudonensis TaxID=1348245 RepID=UPI000AB86F88|nr:hypothetical protein [Kordia jejudonensis]
MQTKTTHTKQKKDLKKRKATKSLLTGSIIALLLVISPYLFYLYEGVPDEKIWKTPFFTYNSNYFESAQLAIWHITNKLAPLLLLILWFLTCRNWWYHAILIPIALLSFQLFSLLNDDTEYFDAFEIYYIIPIMMIITPIVYLIRIKLFDKLIHGIDLKKIEAELEEYERKEKEQQSLLINKQE